MKIVGVERIQYVSKAGKDVNAYRFHFTDVSDDRVNGESASNVYVRAEVAKPFLDNYKTLSDVIGLMVTVNYRPGYNGIAVPEGIYLQ